VSCKKTLPAYTPITSATRLVFAPVFEMVL